VVQSRFTALEPYVVHLERLARQALEGTLEGEARALRVHLDGGPGVRLRETIPLDVRREAGVFLTGAVLRDRLFDQTLSGQPEPLSHRLVIDPACGAGDLLLAAASRLPLGTSLPGTLYAWGRAIHGYDLVPELVRLTRARLVLLAHQRGARPVRGNTRSFDVFLPHLHTADGLAALRSKTSPATVVVNPPFGTQVEHRRNWGSGLVNGAAVFLDDLLPLLRRRSLLLAILPDVLRTGARYSRWRSMVEGYGSVKAVEPIGRFDPWTDVDVFILRLAVGAPTSASASRAWFTSADPSETVGDHFQIREASPHSGPRTHPCAGRTAAPPRSLPGPGRRWGGSG